MYGIRINAPRTDFHGLFFIDLKKSTLANDVALTFENAETAQGYLNNLMFNENFYVDEIPDETINCS